MEFIVVVDQNMAIGCDGGLLFHVPEDLAFFKKTTMGHPVLLGRKTLETFPGGKPLPGRKNLVLSRDAAFQVEGAEVLRSYADLAPYMAAQGEDEVFLIGGASLYQALVPYCRGGYMTILQVAADRADAYFPDLGKDPAWVDEGIVATSSPASEIAFEVHYFRRLQDSTREAGHD